MIFRGRVRRFRLRLSSWIHRPPGSGIDRRLGQHIIVERDDLMLAPPGVAAAPLFRDGAPIGACLDLVGLARRLVFREPALILVDRLGRSHLRQNDRGAGTGARARPPILRRYQRRGSEQRERDQATANRLASHAAVVAEISPTSRQRPAVRDRQRGWRAHPAPRGTGRSWPRLARGSAGPPNGSGSPAACFRGWR